MSEELKGKELDGKGKGVRERKEKGKEWGSFLYFHDGLWVDGKVD